MCFASIFRGDRHEWRMPYGMFDRRHANFSLATPTFFKISIAGHTKSTADPRLGHINFGNNPPPMVIGDRYDYLGAHLEVRCW